MKHFLIFIFLNFILISVEAQLITSEESFFTHKYTTDDGLSQSNANTILKDHKGFLWIGTDEGLNRFDGYEFKIFYNGSDDSLSLRDDKILTLFEDNRQNLWIGTNLGGLNRYDRSTQSFTSFTYNPADDLSLSNNTVNSIFQDSKGRLWIGTLWGLNLLVPETSSFYKYYHSSGEKSIAHNDIQGISEKDGKIWVATKGGLSFIDVETLEPSTVRIKHNTEKAQDINAKIECLYIDSLGTIWIGTNGAGLIKFNEETATYTQYSLTKETNNNTSDIILSIIEDKRGELLIGTDGSGLFKFYSTRNNFSKIYSKNDPTIFSSSINGIMKDQDGFIWLGVYGAGFVQIDDVNRGFYHMEYFNETMKNIGKNSVLCITEDKEQNVWFGTDGAGLYEYNPNTSEIKSYLHDPNDQNTISSNVVKSLLVDHSGNLFIGTYAGGLNYINKKGNKITHFYANNMDSSSLPTNHVWDIYEDSENRIWVGLLGGFCEFIPDIKEFIRYPIDIFDPGSLGSFDITKIYEDKNKNLWVGTMEGGLGQLDKSTRQFKRYVYDENNLVGISNNDIKDIFEDKVGKLWIATNGGGLNYYDEELDQFIWWKSNTNLSDEALSVLQDDEENFWIGTYQGLARYNAITDVVKYYTKGSGVQGNEFNYDSKLKASDGTFYFGGLNGVTYFKPGEIKPNLEIPKIAITGFYLFHEEINHASHPNIIKGDINAIDEINLSYDQNIFSIKFAALSYSVPKKNDYAYQLEGFDKGWNYVNTQRQATYTNIPPGRYTFRVITSNNEGYWNENGKKIVINIMPPWYRQTWAYTLFLTLAALMFYAVIRLRTGILLRQKGILESKVALRTLQIEKQKKELIERNNYITEQNEELKHKNEEIQTQREQLEEKSVLLEQAHSEIKKANDELKKYNEKLEKTVDQRTVELRHTIAQLIKTDKELNTFLYRSSHDLRGPIVTLIGLTQLAKMEIEDDRYHFFFDKIKKACSDMLQFLKKLNDSNVLFKATRVDHKLNWHKIVSDVKTELSKVDPENHVKKILEIDIDQQLYSDEVMIKTIIQNLMENSVIFCRRQDPFVKLRLSYGNQHLIISVVDNGIGIDPKIHDRIFTMFFRGSGLSKGNGLGLYLVQRAAEIVDGKIEFNSQKKETTEFKVSIPIEKSEPLHVNQHAEVVQKLFEDNF